MIYLKSSCKAENAYRFVIVVQIDESSNRQQQVQHHYTNQKPYERLGVAR